MRIGHSLRLRGNTVATKGELAVSIHKRTLKTGKTTFRVMWRDATGKQRSKSFATLAAAKTFNAEVHLGRVPVQRDARTTLAAWLEEWFLTYRQEWSVTTIRQRASICDKWVVPLIGDQPVASLDGRAIRAFRQQMLDEGASNNTANSVLAVLSAALTAAVQHELLEHNPCRTVRKMPTLKTSARALTPEQVETYRWHMPTERDRLIVSLIAYAGLRPAEVCGLQWRHIRDHSILVEQSAQDAMIVPTKTKSRRSVTLCDALRSDLEEYGRRGDDDLVIVGSRGSFLNWKNWFRRVWLPASHAVGLTFRPYDLRHTFVSLQIHAGKNVMQVAAEAGHANPTMTLNVYGHVFTEAQVAPHVPPDDAIRSARVAVAASHRARASQAAPSASA